MPRGLDHIVHAVRDLDAAADFYRRAGFIVSTRNVHPWGTHNHVVQLDNFYIEILTVAEPELIVPHSQHSFSFGAFHRDFLARGDGLNMILLKSDNARDDADAFRKAAIGEFEVFDFERQGVGPNDRLVTLAFSLVFACDPLSPHMGFATCQHHYPENFWNLARQTHANGVSGVLGAVLVADSPTDHHIFLAALTGVRELHASSLGIVSQTPRGDVEILEATAMRDQFGVTPKIERTGATLQGLRLAVKDIDAVEGILRAGKIASHRHIGRLIVPPEAAFGATLIFEQQKKA